MSFDISLHPETRALYDALRLVPHGTEITYAEISKVIGRNVATEARSRLVSAIRIALRDDGAAFTTIRGIGLRRMLPDEAPDIGKHARKRQRRTSKRAIAAMLHVEAASNGLAPDAQRRLAAEISTHGLLAEIATDKAAGQQTANTGTVGPAVAAQTFIDHLKDPGRRNSA